MNRKRPANRMQDAAPASNVDAAALAGAPLDPEPTASVKGWAARVDWTLWAIIALGAILRLILLAMKPPHFDEGINGWFVDQMTKNGFYKYDPTNYHGPLHFYVLFISQTLFGRNLWALRMPVVLASIFCIRLTFKFEPFVGRTVSRWAALAMAVSPAFVFYGRYSIHEVWLLMSSMFFILGALGLWKFGTRNYLWFAIAGLVGMILTKETYIIHVGCAVIAVLVAWISNKITPAEDARPVAQQWSSLDLAAGVGVGLAAIIFFYSGTFMNFSGLKGLYLTFSAWFETGHKGNGHEKEWWYWLMLIGRYEAVVGLGLLACVLCQFFREIATRYLAIYGVGTLMAYSIVAYKTPWCIISFVWPLLFIFGAGLVFLMRTSRTVSLGVGAAFLAASLVLSIRLNYFRCTTDSEPYVYVQTYNDISRLADPLLALARKNPANYQLVGHMIRPSAYPFPWILGDFPRVGYYEKDALPAQLDADFLLVQEDKIKTVEERLQNAYYTMPLTIRPYQDSSKLFLSAKVFKNYFKGRVPDFAGGKAGSARP